MAPQLRFAVARPRNRRVRLIVSLFSRRLLTPIRQFLLRPVWFPTLLREAGYVEGQNLQVHRRYANGKIERLPGLAKELVTLQLDVILAVSPAAIKPALDATRTIPIVMGFGKDREGRANREPCKTRRQHYGRCRRS